MLVVIASRFPETEKPLPLKTEKCHNIGCLYSISGFLMALTAALKAQIAAWYKALQEQIPDFIPRAPQRQMIADVAKTLAGEEGRHLAIEAPTGVGKTLSYLIPGIAIAREEQKTAGGEYRQRGVAGSDLQQRFTAAEKDHSRS
ncbi:ATP-dependent DNA helicase DinG [Escherichia coli O104:H4 str. LB226692]|nr:ATP-dependent DNA helicase DinG [Escherichia coli O104:H4 str. LB226692]